MVAKLTDDVIQETVNAVASCGGNITKAAMLLKRTPSTVSHRVNIATSRGIVATVEASEEVDEEIALLDRVRVLESALKSAQQEAMTREAVRKKLFEFVDAEPVTPGWLLKPGKSPDCLGVPTVFLSDWHWGEVVNPTEIQGANAFNLEIANARTKRLVETSIGLLFHHMADAKYDGLVLALGGDMVTGDIHEELSKTNDAPIMPTVLDLFGVLITVIEGFAERFDRIFIPCVTGNHGRNTKKVQSKERTATNFDWLVYQLLARHFKGRKGIKFAIPDGPDCQYQVYGHRYLLTHGDQFRGGDGLIGPIGPLTRGRHKKSSRDASLQRHWDTMVCGHFHTLMQLPHLVVNGSLKGLDEYAFANNFSYERPAQACWITHPKQGITFQMPIYVDDAQEAPGTDWVSWEAA